MIVIVKNTSPIDTIVRDLKPGSYTVVDARNPIMLPEKVTGIIIGGSTDHVYEKIVIGNIQTIVQGGILKGVPILGICYGMQLIAYLFGGEVTKLATKMFKDFPISYDSKNPIFQNLTAKTASFSNEDIVSRVPKGFKMTGYVTGTKRVVAIYNKQHQIYGLQFHPEHKDETRVVLKNFERICNQNQNQNQVMNAPDVRALLIAKLTEMRNLERTNKQYFKVKAYNAVIDQLAASQKPIYSIEDLASFEHIGKGIKDKIQQIIETGSIEGINETDLETTKVVDLLSKIYGIGVVKATELYKDHGIKTIEDLQLPENQALLNDKQLLGIKYYDDIEKRIPRKEMDKHRDLIASIMKIFPKTKYEIAGSYRRGKPDSGDIDLIISSSEKWTLADIIKEFKAKNYLKDDLAIGDKKYMGMCKLPRFKTCRRIDILYTEPERYPFAILYFTGSQNFNVNMRNIALGKGYSLNEYGLKPIGGKKDDQIDHVFRSEQDIFYFLGMKWVDPIARL